jgi:pantoate--beta-alanine ligase
MIVFKTSAELRNYIDSQRNLGRSIGFIPTMGALHKGHISLINSARQSQKLTICSIFVNPAQFNDKQDFDKYPHSIADDILLLSAAGCDVLFLPTVQEIYPNGPENAPEYHFGFLESVFEGAQRPGHFNGVGTIVKRLFEIVKPNKAYFGEKDFQQLQIVKKLVSKHKIPIEVIGCPIHRETNGLAMSSRNERLSESSREKAAIIYQILNTNTVMNL